MFLQKYPHFSRYWRLKREHSRFLIKEGEPLILKKEEDCVVGCSAPGDNTLGNKCWDTGWGGHDQLTRRDTSVHIIKS